MQKNNKKIYLIIIGILLLICSMVAISYAVWRIFLVQNNSSKLATSCFKVSLTDQDAINLVDTIPITDSDGAALNPYTFTITNACDSYANYQVNLELLNTTTMTNMSAIKVMFDDETPSLLTTKQTTEKTLSNASTAYKLKTSYLDKKGTTTHKLRLWIDEAVDMNTEGVQNLKLVAKVTVTASYAKELPKPPMVSEYITTLAQTDTTNLAVDDYGNTRYIGKDPNNYVSFEGDIWRIIGVMKDVDDGTGNKEDRVKIIRSTSIGGYSWDTSESSINNGRGVNEWSQAKLMKLLNPGYESETIGGSLYWNNKSGTCYNNENNGTSACDFINTGIKDKLKNMLGNAVWNTGAIDDESDDESYDYYNITTSKFYEIERSTNPSKICSDNDECTDTVTRTTTWIGKVGLMYPSDYGYATSGGSGADRATCLNKELYNWSDSSDCPNNDWLFNSSYEQWTLSPFGSVHDANQALVVNGSGGVSEIPANSGSGVRPVGYLLSNVGVQSGDGSSGNPFILS